MKINAVHSVYFSPVCHTREYVDILANNLAQLWNLDEPQEMDITREGGKGGNFDAESLVVIGIPVYGGRVPALAVKRIKNLRGNGAPAVLVASYGNRAYEDALAELYDTVAEAGFRPVAATACIAGHTIAPAIASGRPDEADIKSIEEFAGRIQKLLDSHALDAMPKLVVPGNRPYKDYKANPLPQSVDANCVECGVCWQSCPAHAITPEKPAEVDKEKCFCCMRCIYICPEHVRHPAEAFIKAVTEKLAACCSAPKQNDYFWAGED